MIGGFTIALLMAEFGQVWAEYVCHDVTPQLWQKSDSKRSIQGITVMGMMSCHSCGKDWRVNEAFRGLTVIKM